MALNCKGDIALNLELKQLSMDSFNDITNFFVGVFSNEPWNDDWSDKNQLHAYMTELIDNRNSLVFGLYKDNIMVGLSMGHIKHWYEGTEYVINEFCVKSDKQGQGIGSKFIDLIEGNIKERGINTIFLLTDRNVPAYDFYKKKGFTELVNNVAFYKN